MSSQTCIDEIVRKNHKEISIRLKENITDSDNGNRTVDLYFVVSPPDSEEYELNFMYGVEKRRLEDIGFEKEDYDRMRELGLQMFGASFSDKKRPQRYCAMLSFLSLKTQEEGDEVKLISPRGKDILDIYEGIAKIINAVKEKGVKVLFENSPEKTGKLEKAYQFFNPS